jgi:hypothetical protein
VQTEQPKKIGVFLAIQNYILWDLAGVMFTGRRGFEKGGEDRRKCRLEGENIHELEHQICTCHYHYHYQHD